MRIARKRFKPEPIKIKVRFNDMIRVPEVRVIDENGEHIGTMPTVEAQRLADERGLDLIEINPEANPPVVKILEYGQFKYQKDKEERLQKKKQKETEVKGVRLSLRIGEHDKTLRLNQAKGFFEDGNKVKVEIILRGRERQFVENAFKVIKLFIEDLNKVTPLRVEQAPTKQENKIIALLTKAWRLGHIPAIILTLIFEDYGEAQNEKNDLETLPRDTQQEGNPPRSGPGPL